jgi:hypothetical protein
MLRSLLRLIATALVGAWMAGVIGAVLAKRRIVPSAAPDADEVVLEAIFGPIQFRSAARSFRGGSLECWYGGGVVDLRGATLNPGGARLTVRVVFGGGQILVPPTWHVVSHVRGIGSVNDTRPPSPEVSGSPHLTIDGLVAFGGFAIGSEDADTSDPRRPDWPRRLSSDSGRPTRSAVESMAGRPAESRPEHGRG